MLVTGRGKAGSWKIRGEQLGMALGADVRPMATKSVVESASAIYVVKWATPEVEQRHAACAPLVWDVVDNWPQPEGNLWTKSQLVSHIRKTGSKMRADVMVAATRAMADDIGTPYCLRHHGRHYFKLNPIRERVKVLAYEGCANYLGRWTNILTSECIKRGWTFVVNPACLTDADIVVALRDFPHKGYGTEFWKSNVKLQNAQNSGTPIICSREAGYKETASGGEVWADTPDELVDSLNKLTGQAERLVAASLLRKQTYLAADAAMDFKKWRIPGTF